MAAKFKNPYLQVTDQLTGDSGPKNPYLQHGWGNSATAKQKEKQYNHEYYLRNKEKWEKYRDDLSSYRTNLTKSNMDLATKRDNYERQLSDIAERKRQLTVGGKSNTKEYSDLVGRERIVKKSLAGVRQQQANANKAQSEMDKHAANVEKQYSRAKVDESNARRRELANPSKGSFSDSIKRFGQSVNESLQKHNDNWQRGMDMILNKNVTSQTTPASTMQKKKVNPYTATGMADNEHAKAQASAKQYRQATAAQRRAEAMANSEQARQNAAAKDYRRANAAANRAKAEADSKKAAQDLQKFKTDNYNNKLKIEELHKQYERNKQKKDQSDYRDASMEVARSTSREKAWNKWKEKVNTAIGYYDKQYNDFTTNANLALSMYNSLVVTDPAAATSYYNNYTAYLSAAEEAKKNYNMLIEESKRSEKNADFYKSNANYFKDYLKDPDAYVVQNHNYTPKNKSNK